VIILVNEEIMAEHISLAHTTARKLRSSLEEVIKGRRDTVNLLLAALFADGHVLLEDYPGSGKTLITKTLGRLISGKQGNNTPDYILPFRRIQFTPDMLPGDVLGVNVFDQKSGAFHFIHGPVFAHIVLADELNRTGPKVQSAFLECMAEKQVTIDNKTHPLDKLFFVIGTQNPLDLAGTYPLPIVQLDRFMIKIPMSYVDHPTEVEILANHAEILRGAETLEPVCSRDDILTAREATDQVHISPAVRECIVDIVQATRDSSMVIFGASTRAAIMFQQILKGWAIVHEKDYVSEDDLKFMLPYVLLHRIRFHGGTGDEANHLMELAEPALEKLVSSPKVA